MSASPPVSPDRTLLQEAEQVALLIGAEDLEGLIVAWNESARRNYGYSAEDTGKPEGVFERVRKSGHRSSFTATTASERRHEA